MFRLGFGQRNVDMTPQDWEDFHTSRFGMDYGSPGQLGGLGQGYVQPNLMYFGDTFANRLFQAMEDDPKLATRLNKAAKAGNKASFHRELKKCI